MRIGIAWAISLTALAIALCFSVTDCSGGIFDSAEEEARADIQRDNAATDNRIKLDTHRHQMAIERMAMTGGMPSTWFIIAMGFVGLIIIMAGTVSILIVLAATRGRGQRYQLPSNQRQAVVDANGHEYLVRYDPVNNRHLIGGEK